jgi:excisionase family DNA binding protein
MNTEDLVSIQEAIKVLGMSRAAIYKAIDSARLETVTVAGKRFLLRTSVDAYKPRADAGKQRKSKGDDREEI